MSRYDFKQQTMKRILLLSLSLGTILCLSFTSSRPKPTAKSALKILKGFCEFVPSGDLIQGEDTTSIQSFYMSSGEITNFQYLEFLYHLKKEGDTEKLAIAAVDTARWNSQPEGFYQPMVDFYHKHPAYHNYPVVNISREAAQLYCDWLTEVYDSISGGQLSLKFRIPTHEEWLYAAQGNIPNSTYSWGGPFLRNSEGQSLANYLGFGAENITRNPETGTFEVMPETMHFKEGEYMIVAPSKSYWPNTFGIYNLNGNVAEMVANGDVAVGGSWRSPGYDIRNVSTQKFENPSPEVGFRIVATYIMPEK